MKPIYTLFIALFTLVAAQAQNCKPSSSFPLNGSAADETGGKIEGEVVGTNVIIDRLGNAKSAMIFNGSSAFIDFGENFDMGTNDFSISFWTIYSGKTTGFVSISDTSAVNWLLVKGLSGTTLPVGAGYGVGLRNVNDKSLFLDFVLSSGSLKGTQISASAVYPNDERWHQVGVSRTGGLVQLYIDGKMVGQKSAQAAIDVTTSGKFGLGSQVGLGLTDKSRTWYMGGIDDLEFYPCGLLEEDLDVIGTLDECFPLSYYPFNRDARDFVGKRHAQSNRAILASDRFGNAAQAYLFNGKDGFISYGDVMNIADGDFTISFWMMSPEGAMSGQTQSETERFVYLVSKGLGVKGDPAGAGYGVKMITNTKTQETVLKTVIGDSKGTRSSIAIPFNPGKAWHHVAAQREGAALRMYLDGELIAEEAIEAGQDISASADLMMGAALTAESTEASYFYGVLDDVRFYDCVMSKSAIAEQARAEDDANECEKTDLDVQIEAKAASCGESNGALYAAASGGKPAYSFDWSNGETSSAVEGVAAGLYAVVVTDQLGCQDSAKIILKDATGPVVSVDSISVSKCDQANGEVFTSIEGEGPFEITWSNGREVQDVDDLKPGLYAFEVRDKNGCVQGVEVEVESDGETAPVIRGYIKRYADSSVVQNAKVTLIQFSSEIKRLPLEQTMYVDTNGYFAFEKIIEGDFMVVVEPDTDYEANLFRAYYPNSGHWLKADPIPTACGIEGDITIYVPSKKVLNGKFNLGGTVVDQLKGAQKTGKTLGDPIPGVDVSLEQVPGGTTAQTTTDEDGYYTFEDIPEGDYEIIVDIPGLPMEDTYEVSVEDADGEDVTLDYLVDTTEAIYIEEEIITMVDDQERTLMVAYPNPFTDNVTFAFAAGATGQLYITDLTGRTLDTVIIGGATTTVDLSGYSDVLLIHGFVDGQSVHHKLVQAK